MPKWLIAVIACVITVLIGVNFYLFYSYFSFKPKPVATPTPFISEGVALSGEIKPGWQLPQNQGYCPRSYYLVTDADINEIRLSHELTDYVLFKDPRPYSNLKVDVVGKTNQDDNMSCGNFIQVTSIHVKYFNTEPFTVEGSIACVPDTESEGPDDCSKSLQIGDAYLGLVKEGLNLDNFNIGDRVQVTGTTQNDFISLTRDFSGAIQVSSIQKI